MNRERASVLAIFTAAAVGSAWLWWLGDAGWAHIELIQPMAWLSTTPVDAVAALLRLVGLALCLWVLVTTAAYAAARAAVPDRARLVGRLTLPVARRAVDAMVAVSLFGGAVAPAAAIAQPVPPGIQVPHEHIEQQQPGEPARDQRATDHVVRRGESLWTIAADHAEPAEVARLWVAIVDSNRGRLRSGDPDLIYPGERITIPRDVLRQVPKQGE